ncbi:2-heptaprenyl-1,4-naphthoquinone methyltransferase [Caldibacillus thermoamylovorans]|uniref:demethylmenaquinone methyltransferase n=1 Tax=Caldibacillus thermoamylovorans TaxID=35841 RepID=UPI0005A4343A|nr:demethylmenaquinone methyltransferase [Caldibacillus thermoamylovorans]KIO65597.1 2-heptaprenyl-1,4-naphthoquinone methyltransferase [Caldibacillus thermoamylovorans]
MEQSKEEKVHRVFENIYQQYDKMNSIISFRQHIRWRKDTMKQMNVQKGKKALDVCCGTADWTIAMSKAIGENGEVIGLDFSENMLKVGREKLVKEHIHNAKLVQGNAMELPFPDSSFEYVTIGFGLRNVPDYMQVLREMYRVLKPGGVVACLETSQPTMFGFRQIYYFYFHYIMPLFGKLFAKSYQEYSWLQESARAFPDAKKLASMFEAAGFDHVTYKKYFGGVAALHLGYKGLE